jgi:hypothetical protein
METKATCPFSLAAVGSSCSHHGGFELQFKSTDDIFKTSKQYCRCLKKLLQTYPCVNILRQGPHATELLPAWVIAEGHTKTDGFEEALLKVKQIQCAYRRGVAFLWMAKL